MDIIKGTIASRGSKLAVWQANYVKGLLEKQNLTCDVKTVQTTGDAIQDQPLHEIGGKGLFVREVEKALLDSKAQLAVHSLKDLPIKTPKPFELVGVLERHSPYDAIIFRPDSAARVNLKPEPVISKEDLMLMGKIKIATGSLRRTGLIAEASRTAQTLPIRGNVDTRLQKLNDNKDWDAIVLAEASLDRLELGAGFEIRRLDPEWFVPSPSQGALVIETLAQSPLKSVIEKILCEKTQYLISLERGVLEALGGDCTMPIGCHFSFESREKGSDILIGHAVILTQSGASARCKLSIPVEYTMSNEKIIEEILQRLKKDGGAQVMSELNLSQPNW